MTPNQIKTLREKLGWTQRQLAEYLGISVPSVSRIEAASQPVSGPVQRLLAQLKRDAA